MRISVENSQKAKNNSNMHTHTNTHTQTHTQSGGVSLNEAIPFRLTIFHPRANKNPNIRPMKAPFEFLVSKVLEPSITI